MKVQWRPPCSASEKARAKSRTIAREGRSRAGNGPRRPCSVSFVGYFHVERKTGNVPAPCLASNRLLPIRVWKKVCDFSQWSMSAWRVRRYRQRRRPASPRSRGFGPHVEREPVAAGECRSKSEWPAAGNVASVAGAEPVSSAFPLASSTRTQQLSGSCRRRDTQNDGRERDQYHMPFHGGPPM